MPDCVGSIPRFETSDTRFPAFDTRINTPQWSG
jgi:hypothetical protein